MAAHPPPITDTKAASIIQSQLFKNKPDQQKFSESLVFLAHVYKRELCEDDACASFRMERLEYLVVTGSLIHTDNAAPDVRIPLLFVIHPLPSSPPLLIHRSATLDAVRGRELQPLLQLHHIKWSAVESIATVSMQGVGAITFAVRRSWLLSDLRQLDVDRGGLRRRRAVPTHGGGGGSGCGGSTAFSLTFGSESSSRWFAPSVEARSETLYCLLLLAERVARATPRVSLDVVRGPPPARPSTLARPSARPPVHPSARRHCVSGLCIFLHLSYCESIFACWFGCLAANCLAYLRPVLLSRLLWCLANRLTR